MNNFLNIVAKDLLSKYGNDLHHLTIVFPNKRAALFLNAALSEESSKPVWCPNYTTISELFQQHSQLIIADKIQLICELYNSYKAVTKSQETLDQFYSWGEVMLADFDDVDKHLADAKKIFTLLSNIHETDDVDYLTEEQKEIIRQFFKNFTDDHTSELKRRFLELWNKIHDIYEHYRSQLKERGLAYEGMLYREVATNALTVEEDWGSHHIFIGFNFLNTVEEKLFQFMVKEKGAKFYWDYDEYYMSQKNAQKSNLNEAGRYIAEHIKSFPNELDTAHDCYKQFCKKAEVAFLSSPTDDLQARYITQWLTPERIAAGKKTAIVLADESLLPTVLQCLPKAVTHVNITTGFPLSQSPVASLILLYINLLQRKALTLRSVNSILRHPYAKYISPKSQELYVSLNKAKLFYPSLADLSLDESLKELFLPLQDTTSCNELSTRLLWIIKHIAQEANAQNKASDNETQFTTEALFRMYSILNRLALQPLQEWTISLYTKLLQQIINQTTIPFHGEPLEGIQIMGVLETRNLDFDHLLLLSCNEGKLPQSPDNSSFIPHSIRKAYELTTIDNKVAIYSYYFHHLMQRANDIHIIYNSSTNDGQTGEMSRFMLQLLAESPLNIKRIALMAGQEYSTTTQGEIQKTTEMTRRLLQKSKFSPSALGKYLRCPLRFYYQYVADIQESDEEDEEDMDSRTFGNIFHAAAEEIYKPTEGRIVTKQFLTDLLQEEGHTTINRAVDQAFREKLFNLKDSKRPTPRLGGLQVINREMIIKFLLMLLKYDLQSAPFEMIALEKPVEYEIEINTPVGKRNIKIGGYIDRLDKIPLPAKGDIVRVIDYKTGSYTHLDIPSAEDVFDPANIKKHSDYYLQAMLYSYIIAKKYPYCVSPTLMFIQQLAATNYSPTLSLGKEPIYDASQHFDIFIKRLTSLIEEILSPATPFSPTADETRCENCPYRLICR